ncbi:MAG: hypothetical protein GY711_15655 [bacterium]|nr:hypothetical protein [bacterium]
MTIVPLLGLCAALAAPVQDAAVVQEGVGATAIPDTLAREDVLAPLDRAVGYLLERQKEDGSWGASAPDGIFDYGFALESYHAWRMATHALACMALAAVPEDEARRDALERAVLWLCETRLPERDSDWDIDYVWTALYGTVGCLELLTDSRFAERPWRDLLERRGKQFLELLLAHQALSGGWAYYDDPPWDRTPTWGTSFCTALVLPYLVRAKELGWGVEDRVIDRARRYLRRCTLPGGAYSYDLTAITRIGGVEHINRIEGSLGRTQVCNWALGTVGVRSITPDVVREGLEAFFEHHGYLDHVRTRPIPHEGFHANAGYFYFFGHYYAARVIELLPAGEREAWHARLRPHIVKTQWASGGMSDFLKDHYLVNASTSFAILTLEAGLDPAEEPKREPVVGGGDR